MIHSISKFSRLRSSPRFPRIGLEASFENLKMFWTYNLLRHLKHQSKCHAAVQNYWDIKNLLMRATRRKRIAYTVYWIPCFLKGSYCMFSAFVSLFLSISLSLSLSLDSLSSQPILVPGFESCLWLVMEPSGSFRELWEGYKYLRQIWNLELVGMIYFVLLVPLKFLKYLK